jgi:prepilin-type N-terminal cleavage/methylation domain-containing protein
MSNRRTPLCAFTLVELLVSMSIISVLLAIALPSISAARATALASRCLANLRGLTSASLAYAADEDTHQVLPAHPISDTNELHDEGFFDYGGGSGAENVWSGTRWGSTSARAAGTRPLNRMLFGSTGKSSDYSLFRCPADVGLPQDERAYAGAGDYWDPAMAGQPLYVSVGTSYLGNAYRGFGDLADDGNERYWSIGVFLRSAVRIPAPAETVLYCDGITWEQLRVTGSHGDGPTWMVGVSEAWHRGNRFNLGLTDGHAKAVGMVPGPLYHGADPADPSLACLHLRTAEFRFDCRPDAVIEDKPTGDLGIKPQEH